MLTCEPSKRTLKIFYGRLKEISKRTTRNYCKCGEAKSLLSSYSRRVERYFTIYTPTSDTDRDPFGNSLIENKKNKCHRLRRQSHAAMRPT